MRKGEIRKKRVVTMSMSDEAIKMLDEVAKSMGMSRSGFVEFMVRQVMKADKVPFGRLIQDTLEMYHRR